jgi:hypothetical protein
MTISRRQISLTLDQILHLINRPVAGEAKLAARGYRQRGHEVPDRVEYRLELCVVLLLERVESAGEFRIGG